MVYQTPVELAPLAQSLRRVPGVGGPGAPNSDLPVGYFPDGRWGAVFQIKLDERAWPVIRRLAEVFNDWHAAEGDAFPTVFKPVAARSVHSTGAAGSPSLLWTLETTRPGVTVADVVERINKHLPRPLEDASLWS
jgi:hypothetical protein